MEKTKFGDSIVSLKFLTAQEYESMGFPNPTSVHCFPISGNSIWFTQNPRGIDIIGGHVELEESIVETLIRETKEESCIKLIDFKLLGAIEVDNSENPKGIEKYGLKGYQVFYSSQNYELENFIQTHECIGRVLVPKEKIKQEHHNWLNVHELLLTSI